jgi:large subunit ribosomal protein L4e
MGRLIVWTQSAFKALDSMFGSYRKTGVEKSGYQLNRPMLSNADISRIINSNEVQKVVRNAKSNVRVHEVQKKNPLRNRKMMDRLNPNAKLLRETERRHNETNSKRRQDELAKKRGMSKVMSKDQKKEMKSRKTESKKWMTNVSTKLNDAFVRDKTNEDEYNADVKLLQYGKDGVW